MSQIKCPRHFRSVVFSGNCVRGPFEHKIGDDEPEATNGVAQLRADRPVEAAGGQGPEGTPQGTEGAIHAHNDAWKEKEAYA